MIGNDANAGGHRARVGQISHSVVLGTFNVGDQAEGIVPDLTRVSLWSFCGELLELSLVFGFRLSTRRLYYLVQSKCFIICHFICRLLGQF